MSGRLTALEAKALSALELGREAFAPFGHACYPFASIAHSSGIPRHLVRRVVRRLARKGFAEFHKGLWSDDGEPRGAGYGLSQAGCDLIDQLRSGGACYAHVADPECGTICAHCHAPLSDRDGSGEAGQTAQQAGPVGQQPGPVGDRHE